MFGDIVATEEGLECLQIENPEEVLELYERKMLAEMLGSLCNTVR